MYVLITGGLGYIGAHVAYTLYNSGYHNLIVIDNLSTGLLENNKYGVFFNIDILDVESMETHIFKKYKIDCIIHLAGKAFVNESFTNTSLYYANNVIGTCNILDLLVKYNIPRIIFSSSCAVYGNPRNNPITEDTPLIPISPYGNTKRICEDIIKDYANTYKFNYVILRYFNVAGNELTHCIKDNPNNKKRIIPTIIHNIFNNIPVCINGINHNTRDGSCVRNYIHILDIADAHLKSLQHLESHQCSPQPNLICNLGTDEKYSILELITIIETLLDKNNLLRYKPLITIKDSIPGDASELYCDNTLARKYLLWHPCRNIYDIISSIITIHTICNV
jgi:UDP-glucose 4-epimerase